MKCHFLPLIFLVAACSNNGSVPPQQSPAPPPAPKNVLPMPPAAIPARNIAAASLKSAAIASSLGAQNRLNGYGLPKNTRQCANGYWIGSEPNAREIYELHARGIRAVISAASMPQDTFRENLNAMDKLGIRHIYIPFGSRFPNPDRFHAALTPFAPNQIFIHCEHGGDRSGAILAYLLAVDQNWDIAHALLAVAFPGETDARRLISLLTKRGFNVSPDDTRRFLGICSAEQNGGFGGLKIRSQSYVNLVNATIDAAVRHSHNHNPKP